MKKVGEKLTELFDVTIDRGVKYDGSLDDINYYNLVCKAAASDMLYELDNNNISMFKYSYNDEDSVLLLFSIPISIDKEKSDKHISERVMDIIKTTEETFTTLDYVNSKEVKDDKFVYIIMVKKINKDEINNG